jgi:post-segregation antitoxin (ccd killing protein)
MPKMQVYLPAELYAMVKARGASINVSAVLQDALKEALAALERRDALDEAIAGYEAEFGKITDKEIAAVEARDRALARRPSLRRRSKARAA